MSRKQMMESLKKGNDIRIRGAALRRKMKNRQISIEKAFKHKDAQPLRLGLFLRAMPQWGPSRVHKLLTKVDANLEYVRVRSLTPRQKKILIEEIKRPRKDSQARARNRRQLKKKLGPKLNGEPEDMPVWIDGPKLVKWMENQNLMIKITANKHENLWSSIRHWRKGRKAKVETVDRHLVSIDRTLSELPEEVYIR